MRIQKRTVAIVGAGNVGVAAAYALFTRRTATEILLVDVNRAKAEGEAMDLMHGQALIGRVAVRAADWCDLADAQVVIVAAGANQRPGETRLDLLARNADVLRQIATELDRHAPDAVVLVASNPVDVLTYVMQRVGRRPAERVIGTGTALDTARFRALLGEHYGINPRSVHAYVLGEHGDTEVPIWSNATIGGLSIRSGVLGRPFDAEEMQRLFVRVRDAAYHIIARKGYTNLAIGVVLAQLVDVILGDQRSVLPMSVRLDGEYGIEDVCLSIPCVVGRGGIEGRLLPALDEGELAALRRSAAALKERRAGFSA
jgi:L-lactate dehydrogenase